MMSMSLVSVVMATYAGDNLRHLEQAVASVFGQTHTDLELIIVVDGPLPAERIAYFDQISSDPRVQVIFLAINQGPSHARNIGISAARGDYIAIMDADDICIPERIEHQLRYLDDHHLDVMSTSLIVIDDENRPRGVRHVPASHDEVKSLAAYRCPLHNPAVLGKASVFRAFQYNVSLRVSEDYELWVRLLLAGYRLGNSPKSCVLYRQSSAATVKRIGMKYAIADFKVKMLAMGMLGFRKKPFILLFAALSSSARLLPQKPFALLYSYRTKKIDSSLVTLGEVNYETSNL